MRYQIQETDKETIVQNVLDFRLKIYICGKDKTILDELSGIVNGGTYSIDSDSDIRRTFSVTVRLDQDESVKSRLLNWIGYYYNLQAGIYNMLLDEYIYYPCGYYTITEANTSYDMSANTLTMNLCDCMADLNGTRNGQVGGAPVIEIPVESGGEKNIIRNILISVIKQQAGISDYIISDIGAYYGLAGRNPDYIAYRSAHPDWNVLPADLSFNAGCSILDIVNKIRDLYPNYQTYFDVYMNFCCDMIPSSKQDPVILSNDYLQKILMAESTENVSYDVSAIKNVTEVFGQTYNVDRYASECVLTEGVFVCTLDGYTQYRNGDYIAFKSPGVNAADLHFRINGLDALPVRDHMTDVYIAENTLQADKIYVLQYSSGAGSDPCFYFLGQTQPHAICVLTDHTDDPFYTAEYFETTYNCANVYLRELPGSPYSVQKLGCILEVKSGEQFDNIRSDSEAMENAKYYNARSAIMTDVITLTTKCIPFLDVQQKIEYQKSSEEQPEVYVVKSISNDFGSGTSSITLHRFCPLYD